MDKPFAGDNMAGIRRSNRAAVLRCLQEKGSLSRKGLAAALGLTPAAMTKITAELLGEGLLQETPSAAAVGVGRREILLGLDPHARCALGVLLGLGRAILSGVWLDGSVLFAETVTLPPKAPAEETVADLSRRLMALVRESGVKRDRILGLGVAVRGILGADGRSVHRTFDALDAFDFPICDRFEAHTGMPVVLSNNVRALFAAELFLDRGRAADSQFFLRCDSGIGGALSIRGRIWEGEGRQCAEIGHIPAVRRGGRPCHCGKCGCLETVSSPTAILQGAKERLSPDRTPLLWAKRGTDLTFDDVLDAATRGDVGAREVVDRAVEYLAGALKAAVYLLDPGRIVLYGAAFDHPYFLSRLRAEMDVGVDERHEAPLVKSPFNGALEPKAAGLLMAARYLENGGVSV